MSEKTRYSEVELKEFEEMILEKLNSAKQELSKLKASISKKTESGHSPTVGNRYNSEDGTEAMEREALNQLALRQNKFVANLETALIRIKNGTYGICSTSGKLISKERLMAVPHTTQSIEAKLADKK
ncbi:MAG: TraR/DksA family transcriptional regulator [Cyclobacteriaceae bacterium]